MRVILALAAGLVSTAVGAQLSPSGLPASDVLGSDDLAYNPSFIGGVSNGGSTSHGVW